MSAERYTTRQYCSLQSDGTPQGTLLVRKIFLTTDQLAGGPIGSVLGTALFNVYDPADTRAESLAQQWHAGWHDFHSNTHYPAAQQAHQSGSCC